MTPKQLASPPQSDHTLPIPQGLLEDLKRLIEHARQSIACTVNAGLTIAYWRVGHRILKENLQNERADYGKQIVVTVSRQLASDYGNGFNEKNLRRMIQFSEMFPEEEIVVSLARQLTWSHLIKLITIKDSIKRDFYAEMSRIEQWNVRTLRKKIDSMLYERTALSKKPDAVIKAEVAALRQEDRVTPDLVFRDPYILEFLNLNDRYVEKDLEDAIMRELEQFLLELGSGFCFLARQKRIIVGGEDFKLDLLFFHRDLKRLVAIDLKFGDFEPAHKGQMELYLRWLDKHERRADEEAPMGLILCAGKNEECIELLELGRSGIHVAEYLTAFPSKALLRQKLFSAIERARKRLDHKDEDKNG